MPIPKKLIVDNSSATLLALEGLISFLESVVWTASESAPQSKPLPNILQNIIKDFNFPAPAFAIVLLSEAFIFLILTICKITQKLLQTEDEEKINSLNTWLETVQSLIYAIGLGIVAAFLFFNLPMLLNITYFVLSSFDIFVNTMIIGYGLYQLYFTNLDEAASKQLKNDLIWNYGLELLKSILYLSLTLIGTFIEPATLSTQIIMFVMAWHDSYKYFQPLFSKIHQYFIQPLMRKIYQYFFQPLISKLYQYLENIFQKNESLTSQSSSINQQNSVTATVPSSINNLSQKSLATNASSPDTKQEEQLNLLSKNNKIKVTNINEESQRSFSSKNVISDDTQTETSNHSTSRSSQASYTNYTYSDYQKLSIFTSVNGALNGNYRTTQQNDDDDTKILPQQCTVTG